MKIDRIIFCLNSNPLYAGYWNNFSKVYLEKWNIKPTLIFNGDYSEFKDCQLSDKYGEILIIPKVHEIIHNPSRDWSVTWSLFWGASLFENEVCMTSGIDQLMTSNYFINQVKDIPDDNYFVGFADAYRGYKPKTLGYWYHGPAGPLLARSPAGFFPTSHHVAKGWLYKDVYQICDNWRAEVKKVYAERGKYNYTARNNTFWGLDECYSSNKIFDYRNEDVFSLGWFFRSFWRYRQIGPRCRHIYRRDLLINNHYTEYTSPRKPYDGAKDYHDKLIRLVYEIKD